MADTQILGVHVDKAFVKRVKYLAWRRSMTVSRLFRYLLDRESARVDREEKTNGSHT